MKQLAPDSFMLDVKVKGRTEEAQVPHASVLPRAMNKQNRVGENSKQGRMFWNVCMISSIHGLTDWAICNLSAACFQEPSWATWCGCSRARLLLQLLNIPVVCGMTVIPFGNFSKDKDGEQETFYYFCGKTEPPFSSGASQWYLRGAQALIHASSCYINSCVVTFKALFEP